MAKVKKKISEEHLKRIQSIQKRSNQLLANGGALMNQQLLLEQKKSEFLKSKNEYEKHRLKLDRDVALFNDMLGKAYGNYVIDPSTGEYEVEDEKAED